jgi:capsular polysaccharide transport system permease protein
VHGIVQPEHSPVAAGGLEGVVVRLKALAWSNRFFLALVILPTLLVAAYFYLVAANQYESSADFVVKRAETSVGGNDVGQLLGFSFGTSATTSEAYVVGEYLISHDAVARLRKEDDLVARFRPDGADLLSRLWSADPTPEALLKFYRKHVTIEQDLTSGITHLRVHAFNPEDAHRIAGKLLLMGEQRINAINARTYRDQVTSAQQELGEAAADLARVQSQMTGYRRSQEDINPEGTGQAQITLVSGLTARLVEARSKLRAMAGLISSSSPQYQALAAQVRALEAQVAAQRSMIAGQDKSIATTLGGYEALTVQREQATKRYAAAAAQFEQAKAAATRQQLYLIRVVDPNRPVKSLFPERGRISLTVFLSLFIAYAVGWLLWAGIKEHSQ